MTSAATTAGDQITTNRRTRKRQRGVIIVETNVVTVVRVVVWITANLGVSITYPMLAIQPR
jgi:hypothetical protein